MFFKIVNFLLVEQVSDRIVDIRWSWVWEVSRVSCGIQNPIKNAGITRQSFFKFTRNASPKVFFHTYWTSISNHTAQTYSWNLQNYNVSKTFHPHNSKIWPSGFKAGVLQNKLLNLHWNFLAWKLSNSLYIGLEAATRGGL